MSLAAVSYQWPWVDLIAQFKYQSQAGWSGALASLLHCMPEQVLPFSTGVIMESLPVDRIVAGLPAGGRGRLCLSLAWRCRG